MLFIDVKVTFRLFATWSALNHARSRIVCFFGIKIGCGVRISFYPAVLSIVFHAAVSARTFMSKEAALFVLYFGSMYVYPEVKGHVVSRGAGSPAECKAMVDYTPPRLSPN